MESIKLNQWSKSTTGLCFKPHTRIEDPGAHYVHYIGEAIDTYISTKNGQPVLKYYPDTRWSAAGLLENKVITCVEEIHKLEKVLTINKL